MILRSQRSTLFPYTTLFRSRRGAGGFLPHPQGARPLVGRLLGGPRAARAAACRRYRAARGPPSRRPTSGRSEEHTSELQSHSDLVCRLLLEKKKTKNKSEVV